MSDLLRDRRRKFVTIREMADILAIGKTSAYDLVNSGEIPAKRFGKKNVRVHIDDLERYIEGANWHPDERAV